MENRVGVRRYRSKREPRKSREEWLSENGGSYTDEQWGALKLGFDHRCARCGRKEGSWHYKTIVKLQADHIIPVTHGGSSCISNIQPLCQNCNASKGNRNDVDYRQTFLAKHMEKFPQDQRQKIVMVMARMYMRLQYEIGEMDQGICLSWMKSWGLPDDYNAIAIREIMEWFQD